MIQDEVVECSRERCFMSNDTGGAKNKLGEQGITPGTVGISILDIVKGMVGVLRKKSACRFCSAFFLEMGFGPYSNLA